MGGNKILEAVFRVISRCLNWRSRFRLLSLPGGGGGRDALDTAMASNSGWKAAPTMGLVHGAAASCTLV